MVVRSFFLGLFALLTLGACAASSMPVAHGPLASGGQSLVGGTWRGTMYWSGQELPIDWQFRADGTALDGAGLTGPWSQSGTSFRVRFNRSATDYAQYQGTVSGNTLTATFTYGGVAGTVRATRDGGGGGGGGGTASLNGVWNYCNSLGYCDTWTLNNGRYDTGNGNYGRYTFSGVTFRAESQTSGIIFNGTMTNGVIRGANTNNVTFELSRQ